LYYRLAVVVIHVPPLRNRQEDIAPIARHLCGQFGREMAKPRCTLTGSAMTELTTYHWPGNIRELRNVIERAVMLATEDAITADDIKPLLPSVMRRAPGKGDAPDTTLPYLKAKQKLVADFTSAYLRTQLSIHAGHITRAAEASGIQRHYFSQLMKRYLDRER
jgi:two-component system response regulator HydG